MTRPLVEPSTRGVRPPCLPSTIRSASIPRAAATISPAAPPTGAISSASTPCAARYRSASSSSPAWRARSCAWGPIRELTPGSGMTFTTPTRSPGAATSAARRSALRAAREPS